MSLHVRVTCYCSGCTDQKSANPPTEMEVVQQQQIQSKITLRVAIRGKNKKRTRPPEFPKYSASETLTQIRNKRSDCIKPDGSYKLGVCRL
jgi:hypothetical protein